MTFFVCSWWNRINLVLVSKLAMAAEGVAEGVLMKYVGADD